MKKLKISGRSIIQYILIFIFLQVHGGTLWTHVLRNVSNKPLYILIFLAMVVVIRKCYIDKNVIFYSSAILICFVISGLLNGEGLFQSDALNSASAIIVFILLAYVTVAVDTKMFATRTVKFVFVIATISLLFYIIQLVAGPSVYKPPFFPFCGARDTYGYLFYSICKYDYRRNYGIFYEPGVYQILLSGALYLLAFHSQEVNIPEKKKHIFFFIILLATITTGSTTGYISALIILLFQIFSNNKSVKKNVIGIIVLVGIFVICDCIINMDQSILNQYVISKFSDMNLSSISKSEYNITSSGGARLFIIEKGLLALRTNPLWGVGKNGFNSLLVGSFWQKFGTGNAFFIQLGQRGIVPVAIVVLPVFIAFFRICNTKKEYFAFALLYINTVLAQSQLLYPMFAVILFESLSRIKSRKVKKDK